MWNSDILVNFEKRKKLTNHLHSNMDERTFFDKLAPTWDSNESRSTPEKVREILSYFDLKDGQKVLDLGTGTGVLLPYIAEKIGETGKITAVDYSEGMLAIAKKKYPDLKPAPEFINMDFENENIDDSYDRIILYCVYPHLHEPVETLKWLRGVNLNPEGKIFIAFPSGADFINNIHKEKHSESDMLPSPNVLADRLQSCGLKVEVLADSNEAYVVMVSK